jgi:hypothetical protein
LWDRRLPAHREDVLARAKEVLGMTMAIQTPLHVKGFRLPREWHVIDSTVTGFAANPFVYVDAVIEIYKVRKIVDASPDERMVFAKTGTNGFQRWTVGPDLLVAIHAHFGGRYSRKWATFDADMTISAVEP